MALHARAGDGPGPARPLVRADLRVLAVLLAAATTLMLAAGTVVTGTGPLAGTMTDSHGRRTTVPRFHFALQNVTQLHADIGWFIGALAVALAIGVHFTGAPARAVRASRIVLAGLAVQGAIGYTQYFSHLPAGLVWVHVSVSVVLWILVLRLYLLHPRTPAPPGLGRHSGGPSGRSKESTSPQRNPGGGRGGPLTTLRQTPPTAVASRPQRKGAILAGWLSSTDHKIIGHMYLITSFFFFAAPGSWRW